MYWGGDVTGQGLYLERADHSTVVGERKRDRERDRERETERESVCVCVRERERERTM